MNDAPRGRFITLEGGEGAGKSVQAKRLQEKLATLGLEVVLTREPGGSPHAEELRAAILSGFAARFGPDGEALLFAAARIDHLDTTILPALARGAWVVSDRFANSTRAYQGVAGDVSPAFVARLEEVVVGANRPDLTLILDVPAEVGLERARARRGAERVDRFESEGLEFHETLRRAYLDIAAAEPERCVVVDALKPEEAVAEDIWAVVEDRLDPRSIGESGRAMKKTEDEAAPESDALAGAPHPRHARTLIGHRRAEAEMLDAYRGGRLAHAWLIGGPRGVGKATLAWRFARFVLANPDPNAGAARGANDLAVDPNGTAARLLAALSHPDFALIRRAWQADKKRFSSEIQVEHARTALQVFHMSAAFGGWRVCIVDCAEDLNRSSANALLKMIEEPPQRSLILIVSHRPGRVLPTIRSRCRQIKLDPLSEDEIVAAIGALGPPWSEADPAAVASAARRANGSVREALARLSPDSQEVDALIDATIARLPRPDPRAALKLADALADREAAEAYDAFHRELYAWLAGYAARTASSVARAEELGGVWDRIRTAARDTEAMNLDRRLHILATFAEIAATDRGRR